MVAWQVIAILATAAVFLIQDRRAALAAGLGGGLIVLGTALMALRVFGGGRRVGAGSALLDMVVGMVLKWVVIIAGLYVLLARWQMPFGISVAHPVIQQLADLRMPVVATLGSADDAPAAVENGGQFRRGGKELGHEHGRTLPAWITARTLLSDYVSDRKPE